MLVTSHVSRSRLAALVAAPALALGALAAVPAPSYAVVDPAPATSGAAWLAGELEDGLVVGEFGPDYGLTIDTALALLAVDAQPDAVAAIRTAVEADVDDYVTGEAFGDAGSLYAGALAKAAAFAQAVGADPTAFGGRDLVADLETVASDAAGIQGRLQDVSSFGDFANTIGQSFAVRALTAAGSAEADEATDFLLAQQCDEGFFRLSFAAADAADQDCDADPAAEGSTDVTAFALMALAAQAAPGTQADVDAAIASGTAWLVETQGADGSWGGDAPTTAPNANSTGLAGWVLSELDGAGAAAAAERAAGYVRGLQADDVAPCVTGLADETGAIAYDQAGLTSARADGVGALRDQFRRTTAQALPALLVAQTGSYTSEPTSRSAFVKARQPVDLPVDSLAPGETVCFSRGASRTVANADVDGTAVGRPTLPRGSGTRTFDVTTADGAFGSISVRALDRTRFASTIKARTVAANEQQRITVRGLTRGESITVRYQGRAIKRAIARKPSFSTAFDVTPAPGPQRVQVFGEFGNRKAVEKFRVVKAR